MPGDVRRGLGRGGEFFEWNSAQGGDVLGDVAHEGRLAALTAVRDVLARNGLLVPPSEEIISHG